MERIVSRADLLSPASTPEPAHDPEIIDRLKAVNELNYGTITWGLGDVVHAAPQDDQLDFQLFAIAKPADGTARTNRIRLRSPTPQTTEPSFLIPERDSIYYFANSLTAADKENYDQAALSGAEIFALSGTPWPGSAYSWKFTHIPPSREERKAKSVLASMVVPSGSAASTKRKRPGKTARIKARTRLAASRAHAEQHKADAEAREVAEREKRVRKNREKKLKKRARDKAKKAQAGSNGSGDESG